MSRRERLVRAGKIKNIRILLREKFGRGVKRIIPDRQGENAFLVASYMMSQSLRG